MPTEQLKKLVAQLPDADKRGMLTENIDKDKIEKTVAEIYKGGRENFLGLIDLLGDPGSEENVKPHYALRCVGNHSLVIKDAAGRKAFCEVLAKELSSDRPNHIKAFLCQELGWAGRAESVQALGNLLIDPELAAPAAMALVAIKDGASAQFRAAWPKAKGTARNHVIDGLAAVADKPAAAIFKSALGDDDQEIRIAAAAGLAALGDSSAADVMLAKAAKAEGWERFQATKSCLVLAEKLAAAGKKTEAKGIYETIKVGAEKNSDLHIVDAAGLGLAKL